MKEKAPGNRHLFLCRYLQESEEEEEAAAA